MSAGLVFTVEPFLSLGARTATEGDDEWTLLSLPRAPTVQYEHTVVATPRGPLVVTLPGSTGGVRDGVAVLAPVVGHAVAQLRGGDH